MTSRRKRNAAAMMTPSTTVSSKRTRPNPRSSLTLLWKPSEWTQKVELQDNIEVLRNRATPKLLIVKKNLKVEGDQRDKHFEVRALEMLPVCNRIVNMLAYEHAPPNDVSGSAFFAYYPLGDLHHWKKKNFTNKNFKPVPESYIWRLFVQMTQALAFIQNHIGPGRDKRTGILHRDVKPKNILVVENGSTYPSFKLHDFGCGKFFSTLNVHNKTLCGTYEWQPPENPRINTFAAEIWSLGAIIHYLATGSPPIGDVDAHERQMRNRYKDRLPPAVNQYDEVQRYCAAAVTRQITPINLTREAQINLGIAPNRRPERPLYNPTYSDELNDWMEQTLSFRPADRPTATQLLTTMVPEAEYMLRQMGRKPALIDMDLDFQ